MAATVDFERNPILLTMITHWVAMKFMETVMGFKVAMSGLVEIKQLRIMFSEGALNAATCVAMLGTFRLHTPHLCPIMSKRFYVRLL